MSKSIPNLDAANFGKSVAEELQRRGLGSPSKRELEALLLHLLEKHSALGELSNHDAGLLLRGAGRGVVSSLAGWLPSRGSLLTGNPSGSRTSPDECSDQPESLFTIPGIRVHHDRNWCSRWPESMFTMPGIGVHVETE